MSRNQLGSSISSTYNFFHFLHRDDVYFVTITQALTWITDPKPTKQLANYEPWGCKTRATATPKPCNESNKCALTFKADNVTDTRYMETCNDCPRIFPWLGDSSGSGIPGKDNYLHNSNNRNPNAATEEEEEQ